MTLPLLLIGVLIAMGIFAALGWSVLRAFQVQGRGRAVHIAHAVLIVLGMATISLGWQVAGLVTGLLLLIMGNWAAISEPGWTKLLPLFGAAFGAALLLGLPFAEG